MARRAPGAWIGWAVCLLWLGTMASAGELRYPALGNIHLAQGTIEMWLMPQFDPAAPIQGRFMARNLFRLTRDGANRVALIWRAAVSRAEGREGRFSAGFYPTGLIGGIRYAAYTEAWQV